MQSASPHIHEPEPLNADLPGIAGAIGPEPEHFQVREVPAYLPSGEGDHLYVELEKRLMSTPDLVRVLARAAGVEPRDIGYAGLKDRHALTTQWFSLPARGARPPKEWALPENVRVLSESRHANKLRTGHLSGNRFRITLVGVAEGALPLASAIVERIRERGVANYFGAQRFGRGAENLGRALDWLAGGGRARLSPFLLKLFPSVVQSELFNRYLTARIALGLDRLLQGEVVRLEGSGASFVVEDVAAESPRLARRDIHLLGPMVGPKMRPAQGEPRELEQRVCESLGVDERILAVMGKFAPGTRRDLLVFASDLRLESTGANELTLEFGLPAGSYATVLIREFSRAPFLLQGSTHEED